MFIVTLYDSMIVGFVLLFMIVEDSWAPKLQFGYKILLQFGSLFGLENFSAIQINIHTIIWNYLCLNAQAHGAYISIC